MTEKELGFWNRNHEYVVEPGTFHIWISDSFNEKAFDSGRVKSVVYVAKGR